MAGWEDEDDRSNGPNGLAGCCLCQRYLLQAWRLGAFCSGEKFQRSDCLSAYRQGRPSQKEALLSCLERGT